MIPQNKTYVGHLYNQKQYEYLLEKTSREKIIVIGSLINDYDDDVRNNLWVVRPKDITPPPYDRAFVLYYKNEAPNRKTIDDSHFLAYYSAVDALIKEKQLQSFNKIKIVCRDTVPTYYHSLECEKHLSEMGRKPFDLYCNLYANTIYFSTSSANFSVYASKGIVTRNIYDAAKTLKDASILFDYLYCPIDDSGQYTDGDESVWDDGTQSTYRKKYGEYLETQENITLSEKVDNFIKCVLQLDADPLYNI